MENLVTQINKLFNLDTQTQSSLMNRDSLHDPSCNLEAKQYHQQSFLLPLSSQILWSNKFCSYPKENLHQFIFHQACACTNDTMMPIPKQSNLFHRVKYSKSSSHPIFEQWQCFLCYHIWVLFYSNLRQIDMWPWLKHYVFKWTLITKK